MEIRKKHLTVKKDTRGSFFEILRSEDTGIHPFGQISISTAKPGETKGGHYHLRKREWYFIVTGKAEISFWERDGSGKKMLSLEDTDMEAVEMPIGVFHSIRNIGAGELVILIYISESYDPSDPDTYTT